MTLQSRGVPGAQPEAGRKMECRICWYVYDPVAGDASQQVEAGTAFSDLPGHWRCPECDSGPEAFLSADA